MDILKLGFKSQLPCCCSSNKQINSMIVNFRLTGANNHTGVQA